ncbi:MAG: DNA (cytosine-5-)-methyltransferase [SAR202 cluster bacterium]|nr:DNA (cytosine-5-)-methyltransferase [SAR202 cluster bacterium]
MNGTLEKATNASTLPASSQSDGLTFIDLFCGIGGFHTAASALGLKAVFACDIDNEARAVYSRNYGLTPEGDILQIAADDIPDHDLLFAGFPCQPFSIIGSKGGFADPRGTLFFEIARIVRAKRPRGIVLENVKQLLTLQKGAVIRRIVNDLTEMGYDVDYRVLNALDFGLPQKRERIIIVATLNGLDSFPWPFEKAPMKPLDEILESDPDPRHMVSDRIRNKRHEAHTAEVTPSIWHENKSGNISSHQWSCALRAGASYNYLLVNGERRLTSRELLRLQGFPEDFKLDSNYAQARKLTGNAVPVPMVQSVIKEVINVVNRTEAARVGSKA